MTLRKHYEIQTKESQQSNHPKKVSLQIKWEGNLSISFQV